MQLRRALIVCACLLVAHAAGAGHDKHKDKAKAKARTEAAASRGEHRFAIIGHVYASAKGDEVLEEALANTRKSDLSFVVATGIKAANEPCTDELYTHRRDMLVAARRPVVVVPAASDWKDCRNAAGRPIGIERMNRLREVLYEETSAVGARPLKLSRLSNSAKFRSYAENAYWIKDTVLYATVNLPSNNNHYRPEAGRNSEYEDRTVANRFWLNRLFSQARRKKLDGIVLFSEGHVNILKQEPGLLARFGRPAPAVQDGFAPARKQIVSLARKFQGKVLLIDTAKVPDGTEPAVAWRDNIGHISVGSRVMHVTVRPEAEPMFELDER
ncbi:hypothetical protein KY495_15475 [Massilia sp. PAMC28688]|nr:hypothetical protein KY495_15475 [Massilia sp. PAMC28688]